MPSNGYKCRDDRSSRDLLKPTLTLVSDTGSVNRGGARVENPARPAIWSGLWPPRNAPPFMSPPIPADSPLAALDDVRLTLDSAAGPVDILRGVSLTIAPGKAKRIGG